MNPPKQNKLFQPMLRRSLFILCNFLLLILVCCDTNEDIVKEQNRQNRLVKEVAFKDLLLLKDFNAAYEKVKQGKQLAFAARTALENQYDFTISEKEPAKVVEVDGKTFYNILIERDVKSAEYFENLLVMIEKINNVDEVSAFIIKYIPSAPITLTYHNSFHFEGDKEVTDILGRYSGDCGNVCFTICTETGEGDSGTIYTGDHLAGSDCHNPQHQYTVCFSFCDAPGGSGYGDDGGTGTTPSEPGSGGAGGTGTGTNPTVPDPPAESGATQPELELAPVYDLPQQDNTEPCDELKNLVDGDDIISAISMVETNDDHEHGYSFTKLQAQGSAFVANEIPNYIGSAFIDIPTGGIIFGAVHSHPANITVGLFSWNDFYSLYMLYQNTSPTNKKNVTFMLKSEWGLYALKINNWNEFRREIYNSYLSKSTPRKKERALDQKNGDLSELFNGTNSSTFSESIEAKFLQYMKDNNLNNVSLFKADSNMNWSKLNLNESNPNSLTVSPEPCNE